MKSRTDYIPIKDLKNGYLYIIDARNASIGIWSKIDIAFTISRHKFNDNFLFEENHYDIGDIQPENACYGTAKPLKELYEVPEEVMADEWQKLEWLNMMEFKHKHDEEKT